jgi:3-methyladenine DNA glycosylase AlkD
MTQQELRKQLEQMAEKDYQKFSASLLPGVKNMLGIRLPKLRALAKRLAKEDWKNYLSWNQFVYFEEVMIQGMILGYVNAPIDEVLNKAGQFIPRIDNWSVNDSFCTTFQSAKKYPKETWDFLMKYRESSKEFEVRVVAVMMLSHFLVSDYIDRVLESLAMLDTREYYASMAAAWAYAAAWAEFPKQTKAFIENHSMDTATYRRMLQKGVESYRITAKDKEWMREERARLRQKKK